MKITIAGYGFVGQAHQAALKDTFEITIYMIQRWATQTLVCLKV